MASRVREAIAAHGPITFAEYMDIALYGRGGFYERPPVGAEGHFVTAPHVHPVFAELLLRGLRELWEGLGRPDPLRVVEVGAGDGTLCRDLLRLSTDVGPAIELWAVERSSGARRALGALGIHVAERLDELPPLDPGLVLANELLDNLPFRRVRGTERGPVEVLVDATDERFLEVTGPGDDELAPHLPALAPGEEAAVPQDALMFMDELADALVTGYALLIDYGASSHPIGEVHGYRAHAVVEDVLADPGSADITAGVDFGALTERAADRGLILLGEVSQTDALMALGLGAWNEGQLQRQVASIREGSGGRSVAIWQGRSRASLLVDPSGLGRLRWLLLSNPGLPAPSWLGAGSERRSRPSAD